MKDRARVMEMRSRMPRLLLAAVVFLVLLLLGFLLLSSYREQIRKAEIGSNPLHICHQSSRIVYRDLGSESVHGRKERAARFSKTLP